MSKKTKITLFDLNGVLIFPPLNDNFLYP